MGRGGHAAKQAAKVEAKAEARRREARRRCKTAKRLRLAARFIAATVQWRPSVIDTFCVRIMVCMFSRVRVVCYAGVCIMLLLSTCYQCRHCHAASEFLARVL